MKALAGLAVGAVVTLLLAAVGAAPALAHPSPEGCGSNSLDITLTKDRTVVRNGDRMNYSVSVRNDAESACDFTGVVVSLTLPGRDGRPTGQTVTLATNVSYPAGTGPTSVGTVPYTVDLNPGLTNAVAEGRADGVLHDVDPDNDATIRKTVGTTVTQPHATLTQTATPSSGDSPLGVTYTYTLKNDSTTPAPISNPQVQGDEVCATLTRTGGDTNNNNVLDVGESWTYTCTTTLTTPGNTTAHSTATGTNTVDGRPVTITPAETTVSVAAPPAGTTTPPGTTPTPGTPGTTPTPGSPDTPDTPGAPDDDATTDDDSGAADNQGGTPPSAAEVLGERLASPDSRRARGDARCISTPQRLRLRARERTIVRVRVAEDGGPVDTALVRIVGPGFARRKVTNERGIAVFRVTAKRKGILVIQSNRCLGADRITVRAARRTSNDQTPRGTG